MIALVGLLGILAGEQIPRLVKRLLADEPTRTSFIHEQVKPHMFDELPSCPKPSADTSRQPADACGDKRNG